MITQSKFIEKVLDFAYTISSQQLGFVIHQPEPDARSVSCFHNVWEKIDRDGGNICFGWIFTYKVNLSFGDYLIAIHHAVWGAPDNRLVDVTPYTEASRPYVFDDHTLFLIDTSAKPIGTKELILPLQTKFSPLSDDLGLQEYVKELVEKERVSWEEIFKGNYSPEQITGYMQNNKTRRSL